jgi:hypothetical protein
VPFGSQRWLSRIVEASAAFRTATGHSATIAWIGARHERELVADLGAHLDRRDGELRFHGLVIVLWPQARGIVAVGDGETSAFPFAPTEAVLVHRDRHGVLHTEHCESALARAKLAGERSLYAPTTPQPPPFCRACIPLVAWCFEHDDCWRLDAHEVRGSSSPVTLEDLSRASEACWRARYARQVSVAPPTSVRASSNPPQSPPL